MANKLVEIPFEQWSELRDLYIEHKTQASCYGTIQTFINWINQEQDFPLQIYSLNGEWQTDGGTYVAKTNGHLYCNTLSNDWQRLVDALNCFDPSTFFLIGGFQERMLPAVEKHFQDSGLSPEQYVLCGTVWYHIPREEALKFDIEPPENITIKPLNESHAQQVFEAWPHKSDGSVEFVKILIKLNENVGLFDGDKLVAWCLRRPLGGLGLLQVEEAYKRRGLGKLTVRCMSKLLAEKGIEVTASVVFANEVSRSMFEQLGFKIVDKVYWAIKTHKNYDIL